MKLNDCFMSKQNKIDNYSEYLNAVQDFNQYYLTKIEIKAIEEDVFNPSFDELYNKAIQFEYMRMQKEIDNLYDKYKR